MTEFDRAFMEYALRQAAALWNFDAARAETVPGHKGGRNLVFRLGADRVLRLSALTDRTEEDYLAETEYVHYLAGNGASVADAYPSVNGRFAEILADGESRCAAAVFQTAQGDQIADHGYRYREGAPLEEYWFNTGKTLGKIHALSVCYRPEHPRFDFFDRYNEAYFDRLIPDAFASAFLGGKPAGRDIKEKLRGLLDKLRLLPRNAEQYGMIHFDYSDGNYNIDYENGKITVFDFDNCRTGWYLFDLANLWAHGVGWVAWNADATQRRRFMDRYMDVTLQGYRTEMRLSDEMLAMLPLMVDAVRMENIIDEFEANPAGEGAPGCDGEQAYRLKGLLEDAPFMGFFSDDYDPGSPFDLDP